MDFMDGSCELKPGKPLRLACPSSNRVGSSRTGQWGGGGGDRRDMEVRETGLAMEDGAKRLSESREMFLLGQVYFHGR